MRGPKGGCQRFCPTYTALGETGFVAEISDSEGNRIALQML